MTSLRPSRVGYVVKRFPRYSETFIVNEILAHEAAGAEITIFSLRPPNDTHFQDTLGRVRAPVHYVPSDSLKAGDLWAALEAAAAATPEVWGHLPAARGEDPRNVCQALMLAREVRARGITHLHAHFAGLPASVARLAAKFADVPFTFTAHAKDIFHEAVSLDDLRSKAMDAAAMVTVSDFNLHHLRAVLGGAATKIHRIYNGIDLNRFTFAPPAARPDARCIVAVGRLVEKKGFSDLIDACAVMTRSHTFTCDIIGTGELESALQARIEHHGIGTHVRLVGPRPQTEIIERVQRATVFAAPCVVGADGNRDGLPTTLLESMALGTPCVATDVTAIPEVVRDGATGLLVRQGDVEGLAQSLVRLLSDAPLRTTLAYKARDLVRREFDLATNAGRLRDVFSTVDEVTVSC